MLLSFLWRLPCFSESFACLPLLKPGQKHEGKHERGQEESLTCGWAQGKQRLRRLLSSLRPGACAIRPRFPPTTTRCTQTRAIGLRIYQRAFVRAAASPASGELDRAFSVTSSETSLVVDVATLLRPLLRVNASVHGPTRICSSQPAAFI